MVHALIVKHVELCNSYAKNKKILVMTELHIPHAATRLLLDMHQTHKNGNVRVY